MNYCALISTVRGKNKRPMTKFYKSNLYLKYQKDIWGESNLYRCALDPNILGLKDDLTSRFGVMMEVSRVPKSAKKGSIANFVIQVGGRSRARALVFSSAFKSVNTKILFL